jgi:hypothetical protein
MGGGVGIIVASPAALFMGIAGGGDCGPQSHTAVSPLYILVLLFIYIILIIKNYYSFM